MGWEGQLTQPNLTDALVRFRLADPCLARGQVDLTFNQPMRMASSTSIYVNTILICPSPFYRMTLA